MLKKSVYIEPDVYEGLKQAAAREGRSVTKQINLLLRNSLAQGDRARGVSIIAPLVVPAQRREAKPDPKIKAPRRRSS